MTFFNPQNPGIGGLFELTDSELQFIQNLVTLSYANGDILYYNSGLQRLPKGNDGEVLTLVSGLPEWDAAGGGGYTNLTQFVSQTAWRVFYSNGSGDVTELALGADGTYLKSNGATSAPSFSTPAGSGNVSKVGTPVDNQIGVWTGDGTIEGTSGLTYDGTNLLVTGSIGSTGARLTKAWFTDMESTNMPTVGGVAILTSLTAPQFTTIELGHATDTTISRSSAGVLAVEGVVIPTVSSANDISNKNLTTGNSISGEISIDGTPNTDGTATGNVTSTFASGYTSSAGDLVFFGSGGKWLEVDADAVATCNGLMGIALEAKTDTQAMKVALPGSFVRFDSWNWTVGATLYAGETLGSMQETIPTGADAVIKVVGFAVSADVIYFNPSPDQQTTVA